MNKLYRPETIEELTTLLQEQTEKVLFYAGGTEIMTDYRQGKIAEHTWVDLKHLPGTREISPGTVGSCVFLNELTEPAMLVDAAQGVADNTIRFQLTLGGNICGKLPFREAVLPLLALDAEISLLSQGNIVREKLREKFDKFLRLKPGEVVYQFHFENVELPYRYQRYTQHGSIDYPILTYLAVKTAEGYFVGLSGYGSVPQWKMFPNWNEEDILNSFTAANNDRGSADYRKRLLAVELAKGAPDESL